MANEVAAIETRATQLAEKIEILVTEARKKVVSVANTAQVYTYYEIGRYIIEDEQGGKVRAEYGKGILKRVSERLTERLGKGWSVDTLEKTRRFFLVYSKSKTVAWKSNVNMENSATSQRNLVEDKKSATVQRKLNAAEIVTTQLRLLTEARDRLLPKMMSGEIEV